MRELLDFYPYFLLAGTMLRFGIRIIELDRLENTFKIIKSNHNLCIAQVTNVLCNCYCAKPFHPPHSTLIVLVCFSMEVLEDPTGFFVSLVATE